MVVGEDLDVIVAPTQHQFAGEHVAHRAVLEGHVHQAVVFDVVVVGANQAEVAVIFEAGDLMGARADAEGANGLAALRQAFDTFQVEKRAERVASLADERAAARKAPDAVDR